MARCCCKLGSDGGLVDICSSESSLTLLPELDCKPAAAAWAPKGVVSALLVGALEVNGAGRARLVLCASRTSAPTSNDPCVNSMLPNRTMPGRSPACSSSCNAAPDMDVCRCAKERRVELERMDWIRRAAGGGKQAELLGCSPLEPSVGLSAPANRTTGPECFGVSSSEECDGATEKRTRAMVLARGGLALLLLAGSSCCEAVRAAAGVAVSAGAGSLNVIPLALDDERCTMQAGDGRALLLLRDICAGAWAGVRGLTWGLLDLLAPEPPTMAGRRMPATLARGVELGVVRSFASLSLSLDSRGLPEVDCPRRKFAAAPKKLWDLLGVSFPSFAGSATFFLMLSTACCSLCVNFLKMPLGFLFVDLRMPPGTPLPSSPSAVVSVASVLNREMAECLDCRSRSCKSASSNWRSSPLGDGRSESQPPWEPAAAIPSVPSPRSTKETSDAAGSTSESKQIERFALGAGRVIRRKQHACHHMAACTCTQHPVLDEQSSTHANIYSQNTKTVRT